MLTVWMVRDVEAEMKVLRGILSDRRTTEAQREGAGRKLARLENWMKRTEADRERLGPVPSLAGEAPRGLGPVGRPKGQMSVVSAAKMLIRERGPMEAEEIVAAIREGRMAKCNGVNTLQSAMSTARCFRSIRDGRRAKYALARGAGE